MTRVTPSGICRSEAWSVELEVGQCCDVELDARRDVVRLGANKDRVAQVEEDAAHFLDRVRLTDDEDRHVDGALLFHVDDQEVDVDGLPWYRGLLDRVKQDGQRLAAVELQVDDRVAARLTSKEVEFARIHRDSLRIWPTP